VKLHEFQAKEMLGRFGVPVPSGRVATSPAEARAAAEALGGRVVVKAQIHAGGRGKGGGVKLCDDPPAAEAAAGAMLGKPLVTHQTGPEGRVVQRVLVEEARSIERELYLGLLVDREARQVVLMASSEGGVEIEQVAAERPEAILKEWIDPVVGFMPYQANRLADGLGLDKAQTGALRKLGVKLYEAFLGCDASLVEINPLVVSEGGLLALDAKVNLDDNGLFRHGELAELRDRAEEDPRESRANDLDLSYVGLEGGIGCMVNGAGLAMATMDLVKLEGAEPANFLDVGGGITAERVAEAFRIILDDPRVEAILVNIFGGIVRCDVIAEGIVQATHDRGVEVPLVARLDGTNVDEGRRILDESALDITYAEDFADSASKVVAAIGGAR